MMLNLGQESRTALSPEQLDRAPHDFGLLLLLVLLAPEHATISRIMCWTLAEAGDSGVVWRISGDDDRDTSCDASAVDGCGTGLGRSCRDDGGRCGLDGEHGSENLVSVCCLVDHGDQRDAEGEAQSVGEEQAAEEEGREDPAAGN